MSVRVHALCKRFVRGGMPAVHEASFVAETGAVTTLLGPSGSGKTTLLRAIAGLEVADSGRIEIHGEDCTRLPPQKRGLGFVFQGYALFGHLNVRDNIAFGLRMKGVGSAKIAHRVDELLELVQLTTLGERIPSQLSGGQRQRVAFARALAPSPKVLLLDEPFGALDARVRMDLREWLHELHERTHVTTLLVTHDQEEALELSDKIVLMHNGHVVQEGPPHQIYDHPATPFVASFIGNAKELRGRVEGGRTALGASFAAAPQGALDGETVRAYVRPSEVKIARPQPGAATISLALVTALTRVGAYIKVELKLATDEAMTVQISRAEAEALKLAPQDRVLVDLGEAKVFVEDYTI